MASSKKRAKITAEMTELPETALGSQHQGPFYLGWDTRSPGPRVQKRGPPASPFLRLQLLALNKTK